MKAFATAAVALLATFTLALVAANAQAVPAAPPSQTVAQ